MVVSDTYKLRYFRCPNGHRSQELWWGKADPPVCKECNESYFETGAERPLGTAPAMHGDEIDIEIRHGICNEDGTPRRYRSKTELHRAAFEAGLTIYGDTPHQNERLNEQRDIEKRLRNKTS